MKIFTIIFLLALTSCSSPHDNFQEADGTDTTNKFETSKIYKDTLRTSGERQYYDSADFSITRGKYISGAKFIEIYENKKTNLDSWKEYYENGQLKQEGVMTNGNHIYVGIWKYYSSLGRLDSCVDYDKKYHISYFKALDIASGAGFKERIGSVSLTNENKNVYWEIMLMTEGNDDLRDVLLINAQTGKATFEKGRIKIVY